MGSVIPKQKSDKGGWGGSIWMTSFMNGLRCNLRELKICFCPPMLPRLKLFRLD